MGKNQIILIIFSIILTILISATITPFVTDKIEYYKLEKYTIKKEQKLAQVIEYYIQVKGHKPTSWNDLIVDNFINEDDKDNGFGNEFLFEVDDKKGTITIKTILTKENIKELYLEHVSHTSKPNYIGNDTFENIYIMENKKAFNSTGILVQDETPDPSLYKFWYDTSIPDTPPTFKISDGVNWYISKEVKK